VNRAALAYAAAGWRVFPVHTATTGGRCSCRRASCENPAKHPRVEHGLLEATTDTATIRTWWRRWPDANIGVATGNGLAILDVDGEEGAESLARLIADRALDARTVDLFATACVRTGSGGSHYWYATPPDLRVKTQARGLGAGLDVRGDGGYAIVPPSLHATGARYEWLRRLPLQRLPDWLCVLVRKPEPRRPPETSAPRMLRVGDGGSRYGLAALRLEAASVRATLEGGRNHRLNAAAFSLGRLAGGGELSEALIVEELEAAALDAGLGVAETRRTIGSGLAAGILLPRAAPRERRSA
jgi:Bifunctional DNA primase/polymerase, N-terminal